jgi:hypothetical protein
MALSYAYDNKYAEFFQHQTRQGKFVILDNSAIELGEPEPFVDYLSKAGLMQASEIMLPDHFERPQQTLTTAMGILETYGDVIRKSGFSVMVIPQGRYPKQWFLNMRELSNLCDYWLGRKPTIGISYRYNDMFGGRRDVPARQAVETGHNVHLLGCKEDPRSHIAPLLSQPGIRGVDSSYPSIYAAHGLQLNPDDFGRSRPPRNVNFLQDIYEDSLLKYNIDAWRKACEYATL